jgi:hypothetical protein
VSLVFLVEECLEGDRLRVDWRPSSRTTLCYSRKSAMIECLSAGMNYGWEGYKFRVSPYRLERVEDE